jgi:endogenous inhibitor of DNA gyrase (YacG/DUF329 family)
MCAARDASLCVFCRRHVAVRKWRPFCSERCKIQDLARWADASYRVAGDPGEDPADDRVENNSNAQESATKSSDRARRLRG